MSSEETDFSYIEEFDPYQTLNVAPDATIEEIQESFKKLSRTFHPDRSDRNSNSNTLNASREEFEAITKAKEILCNSQKREAYDHFGNKGIEMMQKDIYNELKSLQIGKQYRNNDAIKHLLKYYLKREATIELDKLVSSYGHCELGIDATSVYEEFVDLIFRHETIPQFISNLWNGIPTLQIVINEPDVEYNEYNEYNEDDEDDELSMSELMSLSVEEQISIIQNALNSGDITTLKNIPVERQSIKPKLLNFLISLGYQYEYNDKNTFILSSTQYIDNMAMNDMTSSSNKLYHTVNFEWHQQFNRYIKFISVFSMGLSTLSSRFTISRNIDQRTNVDINLYFNFMDIFWKTFWNLFSTNYHYDDMQNENAADLFENVFSDSIDSKSDKSDKSYLNILPELLTVIKNGLFSIYNFVFNSYGVINNSTESSLYPGFDISFGIRRIIFNEWMAISSIRLGRSPSFSWNILKNIGTKQWNFQIDHDIKRKAFSFLIKHEKSLEKTVKFYISLQFDISNIIRFECGFNKLMIDNDLQEMIDNFKRQTNRQHTSDYNITSNIDLNTSIGIDISLRQGISFKFGLKRGPSHFNIPIKLAQSPTNLKQIILSLTIPIITYYGYKLYYKPYSMKKYNEKITKNLNNKGLLLYNKRQFALKQQSIMIKESNINQKIENQKENGLVILCAFYGDKVEGKLFDAIRKHLNLDDDDDDDDDGKHEENEEDEEEEEDEEHEEKEINYTNDTTSGPPPLLFDIYYRNNKKKEKKKNKKKIIENKYNINLCDIDWLSIENELEDIMTNNGREDMHLPSFINVRIVIQYMINNDKSILILSSGTKSYLPGFYDCCPDKYLSKQLFIIYKYNNQYKYVTLPDMFPLTLPNQSHLNWFNCRDTTRC